MILLENIKKTFKPRRHANNNSLCPDHLLQPPKYPLRVPIVTMSTQTHYATLGLQHNAPLPVIKAAYKALALVHHPDKNIISDESPSQRAEHANASRAVQEAYNILSNPSLKATYDAELQQQTITVDTVRSHFDNVSSSQGQAKGCDSQNQPSVTVFATTPEERIAVRMSIQRQFEQIEQSRADQSQADALMDTTALEFTVKCWLELAEQQKGDAIMEAYCKIQALEYEKKLSVRKTEQADSLKHRSKSKTAPRDQGRLVKSSTNTQRRATAKANERDQAEKDMIKVWADLNRSRASENARREQMKQSRIEAKAAAAQAMKEAHNKKLQEAAARKAEFIAKVRAKAAPGPKAFNTAPLASSKHDSGEAHASKPGTVTTTVKQSPSVKKPCRKCDQTHTCVAEWKRCSIISAKSENTNRSFLTLI